MIPNINIIALFVSAGLIILIPIYMFKKFKSNRNVTQGMMGGMLIFLGSNVLKMILMILITNLIPNSEALDKAAGLDLLGLGLLESFITSVSIFALSFLILNYQSKKIVEPQLPLIYALTYTIMNSMVYIGPLIQQAMFAISVNANLADLSVLVTEQMPIETINEVSSTLQNTSFIVFLDLGLSWFFEIVILMSSFLYMYLFFQQDGEDYKFLELGISFGILLIYRFISIMSMTYLSDMAILYMLIKLILVLLVWMVVKKDESLNFN